MTKSCFSALPPVCALLLATAVSAFSQGAGSATITGTVTDPSGAVVPARPS